jgi:leucine rich repeat domain protein
MRKKLHTLLALSLLSAATLAVSCNKDNKDPDFNGNGEDTTATTNTISPNPPKDNAILYYYDENAGTLYKRAGKSWNAIGSLVGFKKGNNVYSGKGAAKPSFGKEEDYYVNSENDKVYQKKNGAWHEVGIEDEIVIKDPNFKAALLATGNNGGSVDTNKNGKISAKEAKEVQSLRVSSADISSLDGIEHFTNVTVLEAKGNKLKTVYLDKLIALKQLDLTGNQLEGTVDLSKLSNLQNGQVHIVGEGNNPSVEKIIVSDVHKATALNNSESTTKYTATGEVDQLIEFDPIVKTAIIGMRTKPDTNGDGEISISEALAYTDRIDIELPGVQSLKGLDKFKNISALRIAPGDNNTNTLDVNNTKLSLTAFPNIKTLDISNTTLEELEIKNFPKLTRIGVVNGNLKNITINGATELKELSLERNGLTALSATFFDGLTKLTAINLLGNNIAGDIDLTPIEGLEANARYIQIMRECRECNPKRTNTQVRHIYVKTQDEASVLNGEDGTGVYKSNRNSDGDDAIVTIADARLRSLVYGILRDGDWNTYGRRSQDGPFTQSDIDKITTLEIDNKVTNLAGLEYFRKLKKLILYPQGPTNIDVTGLSSLEELEIAGGTIQTVTGVSNTLKKVSLTKAGNITKLDLTKVSSIEIINIVEQSTNAGRIECIALPPNKVETIKASLYVKKENGTIDNDKTDLYRSKVQSTPCN